MALLSSITPGTVGGPISANISTGPTATSSQQASRNAQATNQSQSTSFIPEYAESPILREAAQYSRNMAPQIYQWGMQQFANNQGNIDAMMRNALTYASPQRIATEMGQAQAGSMQAAEAGRQNAIRDLQGYGINPSSGRYAALDQASRVMAGAGAAGAGNVQREMTTQSGLGQQQAAQGLSLQNVATGYGAANAANQYLGNTMALKFPPLGTTASASGQSTDTSSSSGSSYSGGQSSISQQFAPLRPSSTEVMQNVMAVNAANSASQPRQVMPHVAAGGPPEDAPLGPGNSNVTTGGFVSQELSPSAGARVDDVDARLNAGEFVIPKDVAQWKGQEFFYKLMAQSRKTRAMAASGQPMENGNGGMQTGYADGGDVIEGGGLMSAPTATQAGGGRQIIDGKEYYNGQEVRNGQVWNPRTRNWESIGMEGRNYSPHSGQWEFPIPHVYR